MKVVLYIGHHKVGSTALQQFLAQNAHRLMQNGILYPAVESEGLSYMLARALEGSDEAVGELPINVREPHNALAFRMWNHRTKFTVPAYHQNLPALHQMVRCIENQITMLDPHTVILCSEVMANFGKIDLFLIDQMRMMFGPEVDLEIYCALRRPDEYLVSWHGQRLRFGGKLDALRDGGFDTYLNGIHFNYEAMLRPWLERCTKATFSIRPYEKVISQGGSIQDFFEQVSIELPSGLLDVPRLNSGYPLALYEVMRRCNNALKRPDSAVLRTYLMSLHDDLDLPANAQIEMYGQSNRQMLYDAFSPIDTWLRSVTGEPAFFDDIDQMLVSRPQAEIDLVPDTIAKIKTHTPPPGKLPKAALEAFDAL